MKILEVKEIKLEWRDIDARVNHPLPTQIRSTHLPHVTGILQHIAIQTGQLSDEDRADEMPLRVAVGMGWEWFAAGLYPDMQWQPGELERDGVVGSPDGFSLINLPGSPLIGPVVPIVEEFKYTAKSMRVKGGKPDQLKDIRREWMWMAQAQSYCIMHPAEIKHVRFHVNWSCGSYVYPLQERYMRYLIEFSEEELRANWSMILSHREAV